MGETVPNDHGNKAISLIVLQKIYNKSTFKVCNLSLVQVIILKNKTFLKSMIGSTFFL